MSVLTTHPALRWIVPAAAVLAIIGGGAAVGALSASGQPRLAPRSAAELLADIRSARLDGLSGTVIQRSDLGLPALPGVGDPGSPELTALISGSHTLRLWYAGPDQIRVALLGTLGETDVIRDGSDLWIWQSRGNRVSHRTLPAGTPSGRQVPVPVPTGLQLTPQQLADAALAAIEPSTAVSTGETTRVAGRDAYQLVLAPRDQACLVTSVRVAIDAVEHIPLRVQVFARDGGGPAIEVAFTQVSFARPRPEQFRFNPPPGAEVTEADPGGTDLGMLGGPSQAGPADEAPDVALVGSGWTSVLAVRLPDQGDTGAGAGSGSSGDGRGARAGMVLTDILSGLPAVAGAWGSGRLLTSRLFTVLITDDGRILIGAVVADRLYQAAADPAARLAP